MSVERWEELKRALEMAKAHRAIHEPAWRQFQMMASSRGADGACTMPQEVPKSQLCFSSVDIMVAAGQVAHPKILARARREEEIGPSKIVEAFLDLWWDKYHVQREVIRADYDAKEIGHGWIKTRWMYRERTKGRDLRPPAEYVQAMTADAQEMAKVLPEDVVPTQADVERYLRKQMKQIAIDEPEIKRISPWDMWVDPQAVTWDQRRWACHRYYRRVEDVRKDPNYHRANRAKVTGVAIESRADETVTVRRRLQQPNDVMMRAEIWELWDYEDERMYVWATGSDGLLLDDDWPDAVGDPFTFIPCYEVRDNFYPMGVIELIAPMVWEIDDLLFEQMLARRRQHVFHFMRSSDLTAEVKKALESGVDRIVIPVDNVNDARMLNDIIHTVMPPPVNPELYRQEDVMKGRLFQATGISEYQRGYAETGRTATEVDTINQYSTARVRLMVDGVQSAMVDIARKLVGLAQQYLTRGDVVRLVGIKEYEDIIKVSPESFVDGRELVVPFAREDIAGEFDFQLEASSALPEGEQAQKAAALQLAQILLGVPETNRIEVIKYMVEKFRIPESDRFVAEPEEIARRQMMEQGGSGGPSTPPGAPPGPPPGAVTVPNVAGLSSVQPRPGAGAKPDPRMAAMAGRNNR